LAIKSPIVPREIEMARGTVKWFNPTKGYGPSCPGELSQTENSVSGTVSPNAVTACCQPTPSSREVPLETASPL